MIGNIIEHKNDRRRSRQHFHFTLILNKYVVKIVTVNDITIWKISKDSVGNLYYYVYKHV